MSWLSSAFSSLTGKTAQRQVNAALAASNAQASRIFDEQKAEAERQRQAMLAAENTRQGNIKAGNSAIDNAFAQFNDDYFNKASNSYAGAQLPELNNQLTQARGDLTAQLAERGTLESSIGAHRFGQLEERAGNARAGIGNAATDFANGLRSNVDTAKNKLYDLSLSAADPAAVSARSIGESTSLARSGATPQLQPLGNVFSDFLTPLAYAATAYSNSTGPLRPRVAAGAPTSGAGSSRVVK